LFDYTSKLSLDDIRKAKKEDEKAKEPKIVSPYTLEKKRKKIISPIIIWTLIVMVLGIVVYFVVDAINDNNENATTNSVLE